MQTLDNQSISQSTNWDLARGMGPPGAIGTGCVEWVRPGTERLKYD